MLANNAIGVYNRGFEKTAKETPPHQAQWRSYG